MPHIPSSTAHRAQFRTSPGNTRSLPTDRLGDGLTSIHACQRSPHLLPPQASSSRDTASLFIARAYLRAYTCPTCCRGSQEGETTFNLQTPSVFVDIRVPKAGAALLGHHRGFYSMTVSCFFCHVLSLHTECSLCARQCAVSPPTTI